MCAGKIALQWHAAVKTDIVVLGNVFLWRLVTSLMRREGPKDCSDVFNWTVVNTNIMRRILFVSAFAAVSMASSAQNVVVNLLDGNKLTYSKDQVKNIEFTPETSDAALRYATTDMTYAEFFAGELRQSKEALESDGVDAFTSATSSKASRFSANVVSEDNTVLSGVKEVSVAMTEDVYQSLSDEQKARFSFVEDTVFAEYKLYKADGTFGAYNSTPASVTTTVALTGGSGVNWGNYLLKLGIDRNDIPSASLQGVVLTTSNGQKYALTALNNLWLNTAEMAFCVKAFTEPHGNKPHYTHTAGLQGKRIVNITYLLKGMDNVSVDCDVYVKQQTEASISLDGAAVAGENPVQWLVFNDVPADAFYTLASVKKGSGKTATTLTEDQYSYSDGKLVINGTVADGDIYNVIFDSEKYISIGLTITFGTVAEATELQTKLKGTYVELFGSQGAGAEKWQSLWVSECAKYVGEDNASALASALLYSMQGTVIGEAAVEKFGDGSNGFTSDMQFCCGFTQSVAKFVFDGRNIKGLDAEGNEVFSHNYSKVDVSEIFDFNIYKSDDDNEDEFTYFCICPDNPSETYHIEFRYGSDVNQLLQVTTGNYAYWMAAGVLEGDDEQCESAIKLFVEENASNR